MERDRAPASNGVAENSPPEAAEVAVPAFISAYTYDEVFPALPPSGGGVAAMENGSSTIFGIDMDFRKYRINASKVTQVFCVPFRERRFSRFETFGEGECGRICSRIMRDTETEIEIGTARDKSLTFLISGKSENVAMARKEILIHFQSRTKLSISVQREYHKAILGRRGERLRHLEHVTETKITIPSVSDGDDKITVFGTRDCIDKAVHEMRVIADEMSKNMFIRIHVPKYIHPFVFGPNSATLNSLIESTNARINVPPPNSDSEDISIAGDKEAVEIAKEKIWDIKAECEMYPTASVIMPKVQHKYVFGKNRLTINEIMRDFGVSVEVPHIDDDREIIVLRGPQKNLGQALDVICKKFSSIKNATLIVPNWIHRFIIGKGGSNIKEIQMHAPEGHVEFEGNEIKVEASMPEFEVLLSALKERIAYYEREYTFCEIFVDSKYMKHIIGRNGVNVNRLKNELRVDILTLEIDGRSQIRLEGRTDNVAKAEKAVNDMVEKLIDDELNYNYIEKVRVDKSLHKIIIGKGGMNARKLRDELKCKLDFPSFDNECDFITISGKKGNVELAVKRVLKIASDAARMIEGKKARGASESGSAANNHQDRIKADPKYHCFLIGKNGTKIKALRDKHGARVQFPNEYTPDKETIIITGTKEAVEATKAELLSAIEKINSERTDTVLVDPKYHKKFVAHQGEIIQKISEECGGVIISFPKFPNDNNWEVTVKGHKNHVPEAIERIKAVVADLDNRVEEVINVHPRHHKYFFLRGGAVLNEIIKDCSGPGKVYISFPKLKGRTNVSSQVVLNGPSASVQAAKNKIFSVVAALEEQIEIQVVIPSKHHRGLLRSRTHPMIDDVRSEQNVEIIFPPPHMFSSNNSNNHYGRQTMVNGEPSEADIVIVKGKPENCNEAKRLLLEMIPVTEELHLPVDYHRHIIGQYGNVIKEITNRFEVYIDMPHNARSDIIKITGRKANVEAAVEDIMRRKEETDKERIDKELRNFTLQMEVNPEFHSIIIGRRGESINGIRERCSVHIALPRMGDYPGNVITITGYQENAENAKAEILKIVKNLENMFVEELDINNSIHSRLIGQKGKTVRKLMNDYDVLIKFGAPDNQNVVFIRGRDEEKVLSCKDRLLEMAEDFDVYPVKNAGGAVSNGGSAASSSSNGNATCSTSYNGNGGMRDGTMVGNGGSSSSGQQPTSQTGFVVRNAPWDQVQAPPSPLDMSGFPIIGGRRQGNAATQWGPQRRR